MSSPASRSGNPLIVLLSGRLSRGELFGLHLALVADATKTDDQIHAVERRLPKLTRVAFDEFVTSHDACLLRADCSSRPASSDESLTCPGRHPCLSVFACGLPCISIGTAYF